MEPQARWALVIDSDLTAHSIYRQVLGTLGFGIELHDQGAQAILALTRRNFDMVLLDPSTPGVHGIELLALVYRQPAPAAIVVVGAGLRHGMINDSMRDSAPGLLNKPFSANALRTMIEVTIAEYDANRASAIRLVTGGMSRVIVEEDLRHLYRQIVRIVLASFQADRASLMLWDDGSDRVHVAASEGIPFTQPGNIGAPLHDSVSGWVIRHVEPLLLDPDGDLPFDMQSSWRSTELCSGMCVPLAVRGRVLGVLTAARCCDCARYTGADLQHMIPLACHVSAMLENLQLQNQSYRRTQFLVRLYNLGSALLAASELAEVLRIATEYLNESLLDARGYIFLREDEAPGIGLVQALSSASPSSIDPEDLRDEPGLVGLVLADGVARLRYAADQPDLAVWEQPLLEQADHALFCVALKTDLSIYGAIEIAGRPAAMGEEDLQYLAAAAALIAPAIEKAQRHGVVTRSEARYDMMFQQAADAILLIDVRTSAIVLANPAAERLSGYSQIELMAIPPARLIGSGHTRRSTVTVADVLSGKATEYDGHLRTRSGYNVPISLTASWLEHAATPYLMLVVRNDTENQRQAQRKTQQEKLAGMTRLTAMIAHEVNNPMQALHNTLHLLLNREFSEEKRLRLLSMAQMEVDRLAATVRRMLDLHRPADEDMRPVSVHSLLESVLASAAPQLQQHHILLERNWADPLPRVVGIGGHLKQVFYDLVANAIEAMPDGGRLLVRTRLDVSSDPLAQVLIEFVDSGPGIPESEAQVIFEPFYTTKRANVGLGLAVSYSIIERHGGLLSMSSNGIGSTFRVQLPAMQAATL
ncbi:MAG: GAF domain-containing protein [Kouleothrix sp.]|jgi:PAS domain S-box-containing protein|nr:GAF domain-containing protein [Kouleothrix sp.]